jgi:hypothetical protein
MRRVEKLTKSKMVNWEAVCDRVTADIVTRLQASRVFMSAETVREQTGMHAMCCMNAIPLQFPIPLL